MNSTFSFPGFSVTSSTYDGSNDIVIGRLISDEISSTITLVNTPNMPRGEFVVQSVVGAVTFDARAHRRLFPKDFARLVLTPHGPAIALCNAQRVIGIRFLRADAAMLNVNVAACILGKDAAARFLSFECWLSPPEQAVVYSLKICKEKRLEAAGEAEAASLQAQEKQQAEAEKRRAELATQNAAKEQKLSQRKARAQEFLQELRARPHVGGKTMIGEMRHGTPVLAHEVDRVPTGTCVIVVRDLKHAAATVEEYFLVERSGGGRVERKYRANVQPVNSPAAQVVMGKSGTATAPKESAPPQRIYVKRGNDVREVALFASMDGINAARAKGLPGGAHIARPDIKSDGRVVVYRVMEKGLHEIGLHDRM